MKKDLAYLGPEGTFTHQAATALAPDGASLRALESLDAVLEALFQGEAEWAVAAETSAAGPIRLTLEAIQSGRAKVLGRHGVQVSFDLYRRADDEAALVGLYGHEKALAQIGAFLEARQLKGRTAPSNTAGLAAVRGSTEPGWGAAGPPGLAAKYDLEVVEHALEGPVRNETVFVLLARAT
jgi:prephenate dehydratase